MIQLESFTNKHFDNLISWIENEEELMQFAGPTFTFPLTIEQLEDSRKDKNLFSFSVLNENSHIGHCEIYLKEHSIHLGRILVGDKTERGKGLGNQIVNKLLEYGFTKFNKNIAELNVFDWNIGAIECYKKVGFIINPDKKIERKINNEIWTAINMKLERERWNIIRNK